MSTRSELFKLWSDTEGYGFFLGHNKMRHENSVNMLAKVVEASAILEKKDTPDYRKQDLAQSGKITLGMLAMQPDELFPHAFQQNSAILQLTFSKRTIYVEPDVQIKIKVKEILKSKYINEVIKGALAYTLFPVLTRKVNVDVLNQSKVYVEINKNAFLNFRLDLGSEQNLLDAAAYNISDKDVKKQGKTFAFYFTKEEDGKEKTKKIELKNLTSTNENKLTKWICYEMSKSLNAYDSWYKMLVVNKRKAKQKRYDAEKMEYLESILSWSLNSYVMLQNKQEKISKLSYLDLQYADRELKKL